MVRTASTAPVSSRRSAIRVVMPVHCAPGAGRHETRPQHLPEGAEVQFIRS